MLSKTIQASAAALALIACSPAVENNGAENVENGGGDTIVDIDPASYEWDHPSNLLANASFEEGGDPWFNMAKRTGSQFWTDFRVSDRRAKSGEHSAVIQLRSEGFKPHTQVNGVIQEFEGVEIPERISGWYRIEDWQRGTRFQFLQVVLSVHGTTGFAHKAGVPTQIAFMIDGTVKQPMPMGNRKFFHISGSEVPIQDTWVRFDLDVRKTFEEAWRGVPAADEFTKFDVFFEARYDRRSALDKTEVRANVYFDDLYMGNGAPR